MGCFVFFRSRFSCVGKREGGGRRGSGKRRGELCGGCEQQERGDSRRRKRRGKREREEVASGAERNKCCRDVMKKVIARWPAKKNRKSFNRLSQAAPQSAAVVAGALSRTMAETKLCPNRRCATFNEPRKRQNWGQRRRPAKKNRAETHASRSCAAAASEFRPAGSSLLLHRRGAAGAAEASRAGVVGVGRRHIEEEKERERR